ncbi:MAG: Holliday junction branch migration protein RuvA [Deltaproteobacteria bacterium]|nr:Holliday junction branch migration protein RuvA [Deltaproteobacteria bacterium]
MIGYLTGRPIKSTPEKVLLDVRGVGYEVHIPLSTFHEVAGSTGDVSLHIHTHMRDDGISLFGFWTEEERHLFELLIGVSGIGPKLGRSVLSGTPAVDLLSALARGDVATLCKTPGVGKKTAERLVLELQEKARSLAAHLPAQDSSPSVLVDDLVSALVNLGYKAPVAERAVQATLKEMPEAPLQEILRSSLKRLSRG